MQFALKGRGGAEISYEDLLGRLTGVLLWGLLLAGTRWTRFARDMADNGDLKQMCCGAALRTRKQPSPLKRCPVCNTEMYCAAQHIAIPAPSARMRARLIRGPLYFPVEHLLLETLARLSGGDTG